MVIANSVWRIFKDRNAYFGIMQSCSPNINSFNELTNHLNFEDYATKNMGRDYYKYVSDVLKTMEKYPGGTEIANSLLVYFKSVYSNRRAMMEELGLSKK